MTNTTFTQDTSQLPANRTFKSRIFAMLYSDKRNLLELYNALNGTTYDNPDILTINTLENAIYMTFQNDVSFIVDSSRLSLYEHQSTYNPNLPLRFLFYISDLYSNVTKDKNLYGTKIVQIPPPSFLVFYNGTSEQPDRQTLRLSDAYLGIREQDENSEDFKISGCNNDFKTSEHTEDFRDFTNPRNVNLELTITMLNINRGHNKKLMQTCKSLHDYAEYVARVREYAQDTPIEDAVERAITECINEGVLTEFLKQNRAEAKKVSIYEYDYEKHMRMMKEEIREDSFEEGKNSLLKEQVSKKLAKGFDIPQIADMLEESEDVIREIAAQLQRTS